MLEKILLIQLTLLDEFFHGYEGLVHLLELHLLLLVHVFVVQDFDSRVDHIHADFLLLLLTEAIPIVLFDALVTEG